MVWVMVDAACEVASTIFVCYHDGARVMHVLFIMPENITVKIRLRELHASTNNTAV